MALLLVLVGSAVAASYMTGAYGGFEVDVRQWCCLGSSYLRCQLRNGHSQRVACNTRLAMWTILCGLDRGTTEEWLGTQPVVLRITSL